MQSRSLLLVCPTVQCCVHQLSGPTVAILGDIYVLAVTGSLADCSHYWNRLRVAKVSKLYFEVKNITEFEDV